MTPRRVRDTLPALALVWLAACGPEGSAPAVPNPVRRPPALPDPGPELTVGETSREAITLYWSEVHGASGYELIRRPQYSNFWQLTHEGGPVTSYRDEGLQAGTSYAYQVRAVFPGGDYTAWSKAVTATTDPYPPPPPENLSARGVSSSAIELQWAPVERTTRYEVQRRPAGGNDAAWVAVASVEHSPDPVYRDEELAAATGYEYRVRSLLVYRAKALTSRWSDPVPARTES